MNMLVPNSLHVHCILRYPGCASFVLLSRVSDLGLCVIVYVRKCIIRAWPRENMPATHSPNAVRVRGFILLCKLAEPISRYTLHYYTVVALNGNIPNTRHDTIYCITVSI